MSTPTDAEIDAALAELPQIDSPDIGGLKGRGRRVSVGGDWYGIEQARRLVKICLVFDQPISAVITTDLFIALTDRILAIEAAIDDLRGSRDTTAEAVESHLRAQRTPPAAGARSGGRWR